MEAISMRFINDDVKVKNGGRKAARLSAEDLAHLMYQRANEFFQQTWGANEHLACPNDGTWWNEEEDSCELVQYLLEDESLLADLRQNGVNGCSEVTLDGCPSQGAVNLTGMHTLSNGFTFYGFFNSVDCGPSCAFVIIYYDGNRLCAYVPTRGNTINVDVPCVIGVEEEEISPCQLEAHYRKLGVWKEGEDLFRMYLAKYGIHEPFCHWDAIQEDIEANITICDTTPPLTSTRPTRSSVASSIPTCNIPTIFLQWFAKCAKTPNKVIQLRCRNIRNNKNTYLTCINGEFHATGDEARIINEYIKLVSTSNYDVTSVLMNLCDIIFTHVEIIEDAPVEDALEAEVEGVNTVRDTSITPELQGMLELFKEFEQHAQQHPSQNVTLSFLLTNGEYSYITHRADGQYAITGEIPEKLRTMVTATGELKTVDAVMLMSAYIDIMIDYNIT